MKAYENLHVFKISHLDIGLQRMMSGLAPKVIIDTTHFFEEIKGALTEQYVLQENAAINIASVYYWTSDGTAEVDFVFSKGTEILPLEVKGGENLRVKSLKIYCDTYHPAYAIWASFSNLQYDIGLLKIPLYTFFIMSRYLDAIYSQGQ